VIRRLGPLTYLVRVSRQLRYVHIDHLLQTERGNCEEAFEEVVPLPIFIHTTFVQLEIILAHPPKRVAWIGVKRK